MAAIILPSAKGAVNVMRVTVTPTSRMAANPTLQGTLLIEGEPQSAVRLPPWTLFPADQAATFVVRVPVPFVEASRAGRRVVLSVRALSSHAGASSVATAPLKVNAFWGTSGN